MYAKQMQQAIRWIRFSTSGNPRSDVLEHQNKEYFFLKILYIETFWKKLEMKNTHFRATCKSLSKIVTKRFFYRKSWNFFFRFLSVNAWSTNIRDPSFWHLMSTLMMYMCTNFHRLAPIFVRVISKKLILRCLTKTAIAAESIGVGVQNLGIL